MSIYWQTEKVFPRDGETNSLLRRKGWKISEAQRTRAPRNRIYDEDSVAEVKKGWKRRGQNPRERARKTKNHALILSGYKVPLRASWSIRELGKMHVSRNKVKTHSHLSLLDKLGLYSNKKVRLSSLWWKNWRTCFKAIF